MFFKSSIIAILISSLLFTSMLTTAQDATVIKPRPYTTTLNNYVRTWEALKPTTDAATISTALPVKDFKMATQYLDGLGRPLQNIVRQGSLHY